MLHMQLADDRYIARQLQLQQQAEVTDADSPGEDLTPPRPLPGDKPDIKAALHNFLVSPDESVDWPMEVELPPGEARRRVVDGPKYQPD